MVAGVGALAGALGLGELIEHGVLPGKNRLDNLLGDCSVTSPHLTFDRIVCVQGARDGGWRHGRLPAGLRARQ